MLSSETSTSSNVIDSPISLPFVKTSGKIYLVKDQPTLKHKKLTLKIFSGDNTLIQELEIDTKYPIDAYVPTVRINETQPNLIKTLKSIAFTSFTIENVANIGFLLRALKIKGKKTLQKLSLSLVRDVAEIKSISLELKEFTTLKILSIAGYSKGDYKAFNTLENDVESSYLHYDNKIESMLLELSKSINSIQHLETLNFDMDQFPKASFFIIKNLENLTLRKLQIKNIQEYEGYKSKITPQNGVLSVIVKTVEKHLSLNTLNLIGSPRSFLTYNNETKENLGKILQKLNLENLTISSLSTLDILDGSGILPDILNNKLRKLDITNNNLSISYMQKFLSLVFENNASLKILLLRGNNLQNKHILSILEKLKNNMPLEVLDISGVELNPTTVIALKETLKNNHMLQLIIFDQRGIEPKTLTEINFLLRLKVTLYLCTTQDQKFKKIVSSERVPPLLMLATQRALLNKVLPPLDHTKNQSMVLASTHNIIEAARKRFNNPNL